MYNHVYICIYVYIQLGEVEFEIVFRKQIRQLSQVLIYVCMHACMHACIASVSAFAHTESCSLSPLRLSFSRALFSLPPTISLLSLSPLYSAHIHVPCTLTHAHASSHFTPGARLRVYARANLSAYLLSISNLSLSAYLLIFLCSCLCPYLQHTE